MKSEKKYNNIERERLYIVVLKLEFMKIFILITKQ